MKKMTEQIKTGDPLYAYRCILIKIVLSKLNRIQYFFFFLTYFQYIVIFFFTYHFFHFLYHFKGFKSHAK